MLTKGQKKAMQALNSGCNVFLSGEAGTGKSYVLTQFLREISNTKNVLVCAPTGIAAINIHGSTLHRVFQIPLGPISPTTNPLKISGPLEKADVIVIDEISMCRFDIFEFVAKSIKRAEAKAQKKSPSKTTKKQLIVAGDFFQLPPVMTQKDRLILETYWDMDIGDGFAFEAPMWENFDFASIILNEVVRQKDDVEFVTKLNQLRCGNKSGIEWINIHATPKKQKSIHLCGTNKMAEDINMRESKKLTGKSSTYCADISGSVNPTDKPTTDKLTLKVGMQVMTLVNDSKNRYQNGSIGIITSLHDDTVDVSFAKGENVEITPHTWEIIDYKITTGNEKSKVEEVVVGTFRQLPLRIAYAITIHKSQGQTYDAANLSPYCFAPGQLYVALSRLTSIKGLHLCGQIMPQYLITSQEVLDFYASIENTGIPESEQALEKKSVKNSKRGGARVGAGRKQKYGVETCTIRIPISAKKDVLAFLASRKWD